MKQVTLTDAPEGQSFVVVGDNSYELNVPTIVSESDAKDLTVDGFKFKIQDAPKGRASWKKQLTTPADLGGTGGSGPAQPTADDDNPNTP